MDINIIISIIGYASLAIGAFFYVRSKIPAQTIANYRLLSESQDKRIAALESQSKTDQQNHMDSIRAIADLQGQIKVYKELPLREMATAMQRISTVNEGIAKSNQLILETLNRSADTLATNTDDVRHATEAVAQDLKNSS